MLQTKELMMVFKDILDQEYPLRCMSSNTKINGPSKSTRTHSHFIWTFCRDGDVHEKEVQVIKAIANYLKNNKTMNL